MLKKKKRAKSTGLRDRGRFFLSKNSEIDKDLGFNENPLISDPVVDPRKEKAIHANSDAARSVLDEIHSESRAPHQVYPSPLNDISNATNISVAADKPSHPTWKRLARLSVSSHATIDDSIGIKRPVDMVVDQYELPCKKLLVSSNDRITLFWWRPVSSPASCNELHSLELPETWEPMCSFRACGFGVGKSSLSCS